MKRNFLKYLVCVLLLTAFIQKEKNTPTLYLIGDSTVDDGSGSKGLWGWGKFLPSFFDTTKISIRNYAQGGTSTRTFMTNGIWDKKINKRGMWDTVYSKLKKGDYLIIQFGLNDQGKIADSARARGTLHGIGNDTVQIFNVVTGKPEVVHSFGWYLRQYIQQAKAKGVQVIVCSSIPKNVWKDGKLVRGEGGFATWALQVANEEKVPTIDLNNLIADAYDAAGVKEVSEKYHIAGDNTHTTKDGAVLNASIVAKAISNLKTSLKKFLLQP